MLGRSRGMPDTPSLRNSPLPKMQRTRRIDSPKRSGNAPQAYAYVYKASDAEMCNSFRLRQVQEPIHEMYSWYRIIMIMKRRLILGPHDVYS
jgi:hypothetical protein